jgi:hypothetical protein
MTRKSRVVPDANRAMPVARRNKAETAPIYNVKIQTYFAVTAFPGDTRSELEPAVTPKTGGQLCDGRSR